MPWMTATRKVLWGVALLLYVPALFAQAVCPVVPAGPRQGTEPLRWFETYVKPYFEVTGAVAAPTNTPEVEALLDRFNAYNDRATRDPLFFEPLVQQVAQQYARSFDFKGLDTATARKIYRPGSGPDIDFSMTCIDARTIQSRDDAFAITLFAVRERDCQHVGLRGLVFSETLVNGSASGSCRPEHFYFRNLIISIPTGINTVTFVCRKDHPGCMR